MDIHTVQYSDESGIQVFGIQMVTVFSFDVTLKLSTTFKHYLITFRAGVNLVNVELHPVCL